MAANMRAFFSIFPDEQLVTRFINTFGLLLAGEQNQPTLQQPTYQRIFQSVCYLREKDHVYDPAVVEDPPIMITYVNEAFQTVKNYMLESYAAEFNDEDAIQRMNNQLKRMLTDSVTTWMYCLHCDSRMKMRGYVIGDVCELCGGWWLLRSMAQHSIDGYDHIRIRENEDQIGGIMKNMLMLSEDEFFKIYPATLSIYPRKKVCPYCADEMNDTVVVLGVSCVENHNHVIDEHIIHETCYTKWFNQQVMGEFPREDPVCPAYPHSWNFVGFFDKMNMRSMKNFWRIRAHILGKRLGPFGGN